MMKTISHFIILLSFFLLSHSAAVHADRHTTIQKQQQAKAEQHMLTAESAYEKKDYKRALKNWMKATDLGNADAAYNVGTMFENDLGIDPKMFRSAKDKLNMATIWYFTAARLKNEDGAIRLAMMFHDHPTVRSKMMVRRIAKVYHRNMRGHNPDVINAYGVVLETLGSRSNEAWAAFTLAAELGAKKAAASAARVRANFGSGGQETAEQSLTKLRKKLKIFAK